MPFPWCADPHAAGKDHGIGQITTIGDRRKFISALIVPSFEAIENAAKASPSTPEKNRSGNLSHVHGRLAGEGVDHLIIGLIVCHKDGRKSDIPP